MKMQQKPHRRFSQAKYHRWEFLTFFKKMITEVLVLPLYLILFFIWWRFRHLIKIMADVGDILNDDEFFGDVVDIPKKGTEQHKKRKELKSLIDRGKLGHKWTNERVDKESGETINKKHAEYRRREIIEKGEYTGKTLGKHVINLYSTGISRWIKIKDVKKLRQDIQNDTIIKDQMAGLDCLLVYTFGDYLAPVLASVLIAAHTSNTVDSGDDPENKNEGP